MDVPETMLAEPDRTRIPAILKIERKVSRAPKTVLLVEDDDDLRFVMECSLEAMGYLVIACADAQVASAAFEAHPAIDILLTDFEMPGTSGLELAKELTAVRPTLPVLIITGSLLSASTMEEIHDRQWIYISKPCELAAVEAIMSKVLLMECSAAAA